MRCWSSAVSYTHLDVYKRQEYGTVEEIFYDAWHPYTWALLQALPQLGTKGEALPSVDGTPPRCV